jgi:hypothetical protein
MTDRLITKAFFDPIFEHENAYDRTYGVYLHRCAREELVVKAMQRARDAGKLAKIEGLDGRRFEEAEAWNALADGHDPKGNAEMYLTSAILLEKVDEIVGEAFSKFLTGPNRVVEDKEGFHKSLAGVALKVEKWLANPKQFQKDYMLPRGTRFEDEDDRMINYLVRLDGWDNVELMEKELRGDWRPASDPPDVSLEADDDIEMAGP